MAVKASSIWPRMPFMHGPEGAERLRKLLPILSKARLEAAHNREVVLANPAAAKQLCVQLGLSDAKHWGGYVPAPSPPVSVDEDMKDIGDARIQLFRLVRHAEAGEC